MLRRMLCTRARFAAWRMFAWFVTLTPGVKRMGMKMLACNPVSRARDEWPPAPLLSELTAACNSSYELASLLKSLISINASIEATAPGAAVPAQIIATTLGLERQPTGPQVPQTGAGYACACGTLHTTFLQLWTHQQGRSSRQWANRCVIELLLEHHCGEPCPDPLDASWNAKSVAKSRSALESMPAGVHTIAEALSHTLQFPETRLGLVVNTVSGDAAACDVQTLSGQTACWQKQVSQSYFNDRGVRGRMITGLSGLCTLLGVQSSELPKDVLFSFQDNTVVQTITHDSQQGYYLRLATDWDILLKPAAVSLGDAFRFSKTGPLRVAVEVIKKDQNAPEHLLITEDGSHKAAASQAIGPLGKRKACALSPENTGPAGAAAAPAAAAAADEEEDDNAVEAGVTSASPTFTSGDQTYAVGTRLEYFWGGEHGWYAGTVLHYVLQAKYPSWRRVRFDDGDIREVDTTTGSQCVRTLHSCQGMSFAIRKANDEENAYRFDAKTLELLLHPINSRPPAALMMVTDLEPARHYMVLDIADGKHYVAICMSIAADGSEAKFLWPEFTKLDSSNFLQETLPAGTIAQRVQLCIVDDDDPLVGLHFTRAFKRQRSTGTVAYLFTEDDTYLVVYEGGTYTVDPKSAIAAQVARVDDHHSTSDAASGDPPSLVHRGIHSSALFVF
jgi:hypothetical protein